jgi:hypothetical protein
VTKLRRRTAVVGRRRPAHDQPGRAAHDRAPASTWIAVAVAGALLLTGAGCSTAAAAGPERAGATPSKAAQMVCSAEAQKELADALGKPTSGAVVPTWTDHVYSCPYVYADGRIGLSVKELSDAAATTAYFSSMQAALGGGAAVAGIGQGAFQGADGSMIVRKDYKVLDIDVSGIAAHFGVPPIDRSEAAVRIAIVVMGCWTGH